MKNDITEVINTRRIYFGARIQTTPDDHCKGIITL